MPKSRTKQEPNGPVFCVMGAGNGGLAMAAHLCLMGFRVRLYNRSEARIQPIVQSGYIQLVASHDRDDLPSGHAEPEAVTDDPKKALPGADIVMVVVPATGHDFMAEQCAPYLKEGAIVVLNPGRTGGALEFRHRFLGAGGNRGVIIAEAQTLLYASRALNPAQVQIFGIKNSVPVAAIPAYKTPEVIRALSPAYKEFVPGDNVMKTSLDNIGAIFHPAVTVLNCARIESTRGEFEYYIEGISRSSALILEAVDAERVAVGAAMGFNCMTAREWLYIAYDAAGRTLFDAIRANSGYYGIKAPHTLAHRYLSEDVPMSLVPIASLGDMLGAPCPTIKAIIHLAGLLHECDYWKVGRTVETMGIAGMSLQQLRRLILEGDQPKGRRANNGKPEAKKSARVTRST
ncbi:MAG: NAD/NADP octopine/nopaline dehydrogenase family protein [Fimbriimonadia bacterium]